MELESRHGIPVWDMGFLRIYFIWKGVGAFIGLRNYSREYQVSSLLGWVLWTAIL